MSIYSFATANIKKSKRPTWRFTKIEEDINIVEQHGTLFCFAELTNSDEIKIENTKSLIQSIFTNYVNSEVKENSSEPTDNFEYLLEEANKKFTDITLSADTGAYADLSIVIGLIKDDTLMLSYYGKIESWLLHETDHGKSKMINILKGQQGKTRDTNKLFDQIISGSLTEEQPLLIASANIWQYFTQDKIKKVISHSSIRKIQAELNATVDSIPGTPDICILVASTTLDTSGAGANKNIMDADKVENELTEIDDTQTTENTKDDGEAVLQENNESTVTSDDNTYDMSIKRSIPSEMPVLRPSPLQKKDYAKRPTRMEKYLNTTEKNTSAMHSWIGRLPKKTKWIFLAGVLLVIIFIQSTSILYNSNGSNAENPDSIIEEIRTKQEEAQAKLIYNDRNEARRLIEEALVLANTLPENVKGGLANRQTMTTELQTELDEINNLNSVSFLEPVSLTNADPAEKIITTFTRREFVGFLATSKKIYLINTTDNTTHLLSISDIESDILSATWDGEFEILYMLNATNDLFSVDISPINVLETTSVQAEKITADTSSFIKSTALSFYNNNLYLTDSGTIKRITLSDNSVDDWLTTGSNTPEDVRDIAIDGNIYVVSDTEVTQYFRGNKTNWSLSNLDPVPGRFIQIQATLEDESAIYLLEGTAKRIIILTKDGKLQRQLSHNGWDNLKGFAISEDGLTSYVMNGPAIYRIPLN